MQERQLWAAVLLRAVMDFTGADHVSEHERQVLQRAARLWFTSYSTHMGSFRWVCDELGIPPARLRERILKLTERDACAAAPMFLEKPQPALRP